MAMSIVHRISGAALYFGSIILAIWLWSIALGGVFFDITHGFLGSLLGRFILFIYTWTLVHHLIGGLRHFLWDYSLAMEKKSSTKLAWATIVLSIILTILLWFAGYAIRLA